MRAVVRANSIANSWRVCAHDARDHCQSRAGGHFRFVGRFCANAEDVRGLLRCVWRREVRARNPARTVPDRTRRAANRDRGARDGVDVGAHPEAITYVFLSELRGKLWRLDREVAVRLMMFG